METHKRMWGTRVSDGGGARKREIVISLARISTVVAYVAYGNKDDTLR